jgi:hypothetical protein
VNREMGNIIAILSLIATILVPVILYILSNHKKELSYEVSSSTLLAENQEFRDKLKIFIDDREIKEDIYVVLLRIVNSGKSPILIEDFTDNISVESEGNMLLAEVKEKKPHNLSVVLDKDIIFFNLIYIKPLLINKNDEFTIKILSTANEKGIKVFSRIVGIKDIVKYKPPTFTIYAIIYNLVSFVMAVTFIASFFLKGFAYNLSIYFMAGVGMSSLVSSLAIPFIKRIKMKER